MKTHELPPSAGRVINSLRDAGYDFNTAVADIVDNSVSANATSIWIAAVMNSRTGQIDVTIADNGSGMTPDEVLNAMKYGSDEREDAHSLGKFGLGLKTASTSQCRRVSLVSRKTGGDKPFKLVLDIDHAQRTNRWEYLEEPATALELQFLKRVADNHSGTVVRWEKCDRILTRKYSKPGGQTHQAAFDKKVNELRFHLAIVFQRFLDRTDKRAANVQIMLNGDRIQPWDPFCRELEGTEVTYSSDILVETNTGEDVPFSIAAYVVPSRDELDARELERVFPQGQSPDKLQGIYVYRENRLIHWGDWCKLSRQEFHFRLCRIELSFGSELDEVFNVDFKKSRIEIDPSVGDYLTSEVIDPARKKAEARYRGQASMRHKREAEVLHAKANSDIGKQAASSRGYRVQKLSDGQSKVVTKSGASFIEPKPIIKDEKDGGVIPVTELPDSVLWQPRLVENASSVLQTSVEVNVSHPFYQKAYALCKDNPHAIKALDYLLWSLANAEYSAKDQKSVDNFEEMRREVSRNLRKLAEELPKPKRN